MTWLLIALAIIAGLFTLARPDQPKIIQPWSQQGIDPHWEDAIATMAERGIARTHHDHSR